MAEAGVSINFERLDTELAWLDANEDRLNMGLWYRIPQSFWGINLEPGGDWECGTTACLAGWVAIRAGWVPASTEGGGMLVEPATGIHASAFEVAADLLGLDEDQAEALFHVAKGLADLHVMADDLHRDPRATGRELARLVGREDWFDD